MTPNSLNDFPENNFFTFHMRYDRGQNPLRQANIFGENDVYGVYYFLGTEKNNPPPSPKEGGTVKNDFDV